jgi:hypothetical protein
VSDARLSLVEARPRTGRRHQIRRHLRRIDHPIAGDVNYGNGADGNASPSRAPFPRTSPVPYDASAHPGCANDTTVQCGCAAHVRRFSMELQGKFSAHLLLTTFVCHQALPEAARPRGSSGSDSWCGCGSTAGSLDRSDPRTSAPVIPSAPS